MSRLLSPSRTRTAIKHLLTKRRPVFLWGGPGIGKSELVFQIAEDINAFVMDVRLSTWDPTDIKGIPYYNKLTNQMEWAAPSELPTLADASAHKYVILFLDELASATPSVQAATYQLILNRKVGQYQLPDNVLIIAAGNRDGDRGITYRMPAPLANRFVHLEMTVDFNDWSVWAADNHIHADVIGFLTVFKHELYNFDPKTSDRSFATPRSWTFVSETLDDDVDHETLTDIVAGTIGEGLALKFMGHRLLAAKLPAPSDILSGDVKTIPIGTEISAMYSLTIALCYELKNSTRSNNFNEQFNNFLQFIMKNFEPELIVLGMRVAITQFSLPVDPDRIESFDEFHDRYGKFVISAA
jgi:hypothetical protein